jgi:hypothetical protein
MADRVSQAFFEFDRRTPAKKLFSKMDIGLTLLGIILGQWLLDDLRFRSGDGVEMLS